MYAARRAPVTTRPGSAQVRLIPADNHPMVGVPDVSRRPGARWLAQWLAVCPPFDTVVLVGGLAVTVLVYGQWLVAGGLHWPLLAAVPAIALIARFPLVITRAAGDLEIGFDFTVLVYLALVAPPDEALGLWIAGSALSQATNGKTAHARLFNFGLTTFCGWAAVLLLGALGTTGRPGVAELAAVALACAAYFVLDFTITACSLALIDGEPLGKTLREGSMLLSLVCFIGIDSLGYLAAFLHRTEATLLPLLVAPLVTLLIATRAFQRADSARELMSGLFDGAVSAHTALTPHEVEAVLVAQVRRVLRSPTAELRDAPPGPGALGLRISGATGPGWLVAPPRSTGTYYDENDRRALEALGGIAAESMARVRLAGEMAHVAWHDPLTGLPNRALFGDRVTHAIAARRREQRPLAVLFCDLDGFKAVNDQHGHDAGDAMLCVVAERLRSCIRPGDTVARLGGDEFAVLLESLTGAAGAREVSDRIIAAVRAPATLSGRAVTIGVSIGIATFTGVEDAEQLLRNADLAMYRAKSLGKSRAVAFEPSMHAQVVERLELHTELRKAMALDQLHLLYQPVVDLRTGVVTGFEALIRWHHPVHGLVDPTTFIGIAEENGLIGPIGAWVLDKAFADAQEWTRSADRPLTVGVNVSGRQLTDGALLDQVCRLRTDRASDVQLVLEITESVLVGDDEQSVSVLRALRELGVRLAIDDFGTGYSSIGYLHHLPVDILKIDRSFVGGIALGGRVAALVEAILAMGRSLDLRMVAEGIEDIRQVAALRGIGCELGQGFLFARPMPADQVNAFLAASPVDVSPEVSRLAVRPHMGAPAVRTHG
jgi:diguanylate cyclase (GGDEF)-like protein